MTTTENPKDGDLYCYAVVKINTHGFRVDPFEDHSSPVEFIPSSHPKLKDQIELLHTNNVAINVEDIDKLIPDARANDVGTMIMVYRAGKTADQVLEMVKPQLRARIVQFQKMYQQLVDNCGEMISAIDDQMVTNHFCKPIQPEAS